MMKPASAPSPSIQTIREFNRTVTERVGALDERYRARNRPLAEARVLWEIGNRDLDLASLRTRLQLDSGYLSRLLRALERDGLVTVWGSIGDQRKRVVSCTPTGLAEWQLLEELSDDFAGSVLAPLSEPQRDRLVSAMQTVTSLLTASAVELRVADPEGPDALLALEQYFTELATRFELGFDPAHALPLDPEAMREPHGLFLVATLRGEPIGCGGLKFHDDGSPRERWSEIKRVWVSPTVRGIGLGGRLLRELETLAVAHGSRIMRLDSNKALVEAIAMYRAAGYREIEAFNAETYADFWFEKTLPPGERDTVTT